MDLPTHIFIIYLKQCFVNRFFGKYNKKTLDKSNNISYNIYNAYLCGINLKEKAVNIVEKERLIAWSSAIIVTLVIIMFGKSCMATPEKNKNNNSTTTQQAATSAAAEENDGFQINYPEFEDVTEAQIIGHDIFGKPIYATEAATEDMQELPTDTEEIPVEPATDAEGDLTVPPTEDVSDSGIQPTEESTDTTQPATLPPGFSGYDHGVYDDDGNVVATVPPDFVIIVE